MNKKGILGLSLIDGIFLVLVLIAFVLAFSFFNWNSSLYNYGCLRNIAISFCENDNQTFVNNSIIYTTRFSSITPKFKCQEFSYNPRTEDLGSIKDYNFLDNELKRCKR